MDTLSLIKKMADFFGDVMGDFTEVVVHDVRRDEIVWIKNGNVTGRKLGPASQSSAIRILEKRAEETGKDKLVGYRSASKSTAVMRSSNLFLHDDAGELEYVLCINQNITDLLQFQNRLEAMIGDASPLQGSLEGANIDEIALDLVAAEIEREKPFSLDSREAKLSILSRLDEKGVFEVRGVIPKVCEMLQIAQPTFYKYIREIKEEERS